MLPGAGVKCGDDEVTVDFLALGPVVVGVAFEAAGFGVIGTRGVACSAIGNAGDEDVGGFRAGEGLLVACSTAETAMGVVIEFSAGKPHPGGVCGDNFRQSIIRLGKQAMALLTRFAPEEFFGVGGAFRDPL